MAPRAGNIITQPIYDLTDGLSQMMGASSIRLGVTGLSRAGKTVFITSLVANLLDRGRMSQFLPVARGQIEAVYLQPQPDDTVPRFDYETHLAALMGDEPSWPQSTSAISELRLSFRIKPGGLLSGFSGPKIVHLDIVDYPGEWLLDLGLLDKSFAEWSGESLAKLDTRPEGASFSQALRAVDPGQSFDEPTAKVLAEAYSNYLTAARQSGHSDCTPGRFLLPGEMAGSPVLTFAPMQGEGRRGTLVAEMARRYEAYKSKVVRPFFETHFARLDRQIVLVDVLDALAKGPQAVAELQQSMTNILAAFRTGTNPFLSRLFLGRRIDRILFAATKADHLHQSQHKALSDLVGALTTSARDGANFQGTQTQSMAIAALRSTTERDIDGQPVVQGQLLATGKPTGFYAGDIPTNPQAVLREAQVGQGDWSGFDVQKAQFQVPPLGRSEHNAPPHIRLDKALQFLIGDRI